MYELARMLLENTGMKNKRAWESLFIKVKESIAPLKVQLKILIDQHFHKDYIICDVEKINRM